MGGCEKNRLPDECRRGEEIETAVSAGHDAEADAACTLVNVLPITTAGVVALLRYAVDSDKERETWPRDLQSEDGIRSWHYLLIANLAEILPEIGDAA